MLITYFGHSFLLIKGGEYSIALDPYGDIGLKVPSVEADYVFSSHNHYDHDNISIVKGAKLVENSYPFEIIKSYHDNFKGALRGENDILLFNLDGYKIAFLGDFGESYNKDIISKLKGVDLLFIPIGGKYTIDSEEAYKYVCEIQPKTAVPIHYKIEGSNIDIEDEKRFLTNFQSYKVVSSPYKYNNESGIIVIK